MRLLLFLAISATGLLLASDTAEAHNFDACADSSLAGTSPNVVSDIQVLVGIGAGSDCVKGTGDDVESYNADQLVVMAPSAWGVASDSGIPDGTSVGSFSSLMQLGLLNNPCGNTLPVNFALLDGTTNSANTINPNPSGTPNRLSLLALDGDANLIPDGADRWPTYLTALATHDRWDLSRIRARLVGFNTTSIPGVTTVLNMLVFEPGASPVNLMELDYRLGYPTLLVLNDPTQAGSAQDPISDFCAPYTAQFTLFGSAGGSDFRRNAGDGTYDFVTVVASQPDADDDGIENRLDPCPTSADVVWDPRSVGPGDSDNDGVPDSCDPFPSVTSVCTAGTGIANSDEDCDGWDNRTDNCPLVANGNQTDADLDGLGDTCDPNASLRNGHAHVECKVAQVVVGVGGTPGVDPQTIQPCNPNAPTDYDGDGVLSSLDNCPNWPNAAQNLPTWSVPVGDTDCDGFPNSVTTSGRGGETSIGTTGSRQCPLTSAANDEAVDAWPTDVNDSRATNLSDVILFGPWFNQIGPNPPNALYNKRFDFNASGGVTLSDVVLMGPFFNKSCTP